MLEDKQIVAQGEKRPRSIIAATVPIPESAAAGQEVPP
jgi:hypothetical protein